MKASLPSMTNSHNQWFTLKWVLVCAKKRRMRFVVKRRLCNMGIKAWIYLSPLCEAEERRNARELMNVLKSV